MVASFYALILTALAGVLAGCSGDAESAPLVVAETACAQDMEAGGLDCLGVGGVRYVVDQGHAEADDANPGTVDQPWRTISRATGPGVLRPGDAVLIRAGVYRESIRPREGGTGADARVTFAAWPGERVIVSGADRADDGWVQTRDGAWRRAWRGPSLESYSDDPVFRREMVIAGGVVLGPASSRADLRPGTFWIDGPDSAPAGITARFLDDRQPGRAGGIEVAHRTQLFWPEGESADPECGDPGTPGWFRVSGLTFRYASNRAQWATFCPGSIGAIIENVSVEWTNGLGIDVSGRGHIFRQTRSDLNGQMGWGGSCQSCLIEDASAVGNNWRGYDPFWEAGGGKWTQTSDTIIRRFFAAYNGGPGIWFDIENHRNTIESSLAVGNEVAGIMLEYRTTETLVQHNVVARTRWRGWSGTGILSQAASRNAYLHNTIVQNEGSGLWLRLDPDRRAPDGGNHVANNRVVGNATSGEEARELSVEGLDPAHVRSTTFVGNAIGRLGRDSFRSSFYVYPAPDVSEAGFRGDDVTLWQRLTGGRGTVLVGAADIPGSARLGPVAVGASRSLRTDHGRVGADLIRVRAGGAWRNVPPAPAWPR